VIEQLHIPNKLGDEPRFHKGYFMRRCGIGWKAEQQGKQTLYARDIHDLIKTIDEETK
jgi:hypothetical protein